jgi:hypothetical protein
MAILFMLFASAQAQGFLSGTIGVSPNTMGTLGESFDLRIRPVNFLTVGATGVHGKDFQEKLDFERGGGPMRGNISRDFYRGGLDLRPEFKLGSIKLSPFAAVDLDSTKSYTIARIIDDSGAGYPENTFAYADYDDTEFSWGPKAGLELGFAAGAVSASATAAYGPVMQSALKGEMFQNYTKYALSADTNPTYYWRRLKYDLSAQGTLMDLGGRFSLNFQALGLAVSGFGAYRSLHYSADSTDVAESWFPTRTGPAAPTTVVAVPAVNLRYSVDVMETSLEAGLSFSLVFLKRAFNLPGVPGLDLSYVRARNDSLYINKADPTDQQKWIDDYSYEKLVVSWGL